MGEGQNYTYIGRLYEKNFEAYEYRKYPQGSRQLGVSSVRWEIILTE
jgi:hypothetical protein